MIASKRVVGHGRIVKWVETEVLTPEKVIRYESRREKKVAEVKIVRPMMTVDSVMALISMGRHNQFIAKHFDVSLSFLEDYMKKHSIKNQNKKEPKKSRYTKEQVQELIYQGLTKSQIANALGCSKSTVTYLFQGYDLDLEVKANG